MMIAEEQGAIASNPPLSRGIHGSLKNVDRHEHSLWTSGWTVGAPRASQSPRVLQMERLTSPLAYCISTSPHPMTGVSSAFEQSGLSASVLFVVAIVFHSTCPSGDSPPSSELRNSIISLAVGGRKSGEG